MEENEAYKELKKNTVLAEGQLQPSQHVILENNDGKGPRILFIGNSITLHGVAPQIGWNHFWGMAASAREKDYVHRVIAMVKEKHPDAAFCICQAADWERQYQDGEKTYPLYADARAFGADVLIMRCIENCPHQDFDGAVFKQSLSGLLSYLDGKGGAARLMTTGFWRPPGNAAIMAFAEEKQYPLAVLEELGDDPAMKAIGLFEHSGVANHPGDLGMEHIAKRILEKLEPML
ncbi:MAG: hypothetical protein MJ175_00585 [Clostridia bacterium]|nr:hypothetical protein [Clostridia bacterium]